MRISYHTVSSNLTTSNGYGYAGSHIRRSLTKLGHQMDFKDFEAPIQLNFVQPTKYRLVKDQYQIGYTPWESSELPDGWLKGFKAVDELWTTSQQCAEWYRECGVTGHIRVYHHGIEPIWKPRKRSSTNRLKFLHVGEPSPRKGGQLVMDAFNAAFGKNPAYQLTIKSTEHSSIRIYENSHVRPRSIIGTPTDWPNVSLITDEMSLDNLVSLYRSHHVLVYPSWGEGFGFIPLQGLATGMPTICTEAWAPYKEFLGEMALESKAVDSPWPMIHPGKMFEPDFDHLVHLMRTAAENRDRLFEDFYEAAPAVHEAFNWTKLTEQAFRHLENL